MQILDFTKTSDDWIIQGWEEKVSSLIACTQALAQEMENCYIAWKTLQKDRKTQPLSAEIHETFRLYLTNLFMKQGVFFQTLGYELQGLCADELSYTKEEIKEWKSFLKKEMSLCICEVN